jgi:dynactin complex subunit
MNATTDKTASDKPQWLSATDFAASHRISERTLYRWLAVGRVLSKEMGGLTYYRSTDSQQNTEASEDTSDLSVQLSQLVQNLANVYLRMSDTESRIQQLEQSHLQIEAIQKAVDQSKLLAEISKREAERERSERERFERELQSTKEALEMERRRSSRLAIVATLPWWKPSLKRRLLSEALALPHDLKGLTE